MKNLLFVCLLFLGFPSFAQIHALKFGGSYLYNDNTCIQMLGGGLTLEHQISKKMSIATIFDYTIGQGEATDYYNSKLKDIGLYDKQTYKSKLYLLRSEYRFYNKEGLNGFFLAVGMGVIGFQAASFEYEDIGSRKFSTFVKTNQYQGTATLGTGFQYNPTPKLCIELSVGIANAIVPKWDHYTFVPASLRIGYAFK